jgi:hypothetical protein
VVVSIIIVGIAALIESLSEPFYAVILISRDFKIKVYAEGISIFLKSIFTYLLLTRDVKLLSYAIA